MNATLKAHIALFSVALIYGANYTIAKEVLDQEYLQPFGFILLRVVAGVLCFTLLHRLWVKEKVQRKDWLRLVLCSIFGVAINQMMFFKGLKLTQPINASLIMTTTPILVLVASALLIGERITTRKIIGIAIGACGAILLIAYGQRVQFRSDQWLGDLFICINASSYGIYLVLVRSLMRNYHPITVVRWVFTFGCLIVLPFGWYELGDVDWAGFPNSIWVAIAYVLIFTTVLAYLLNAYALTALQPSVVSMYIYLQPVLAGTIAILLGKDEMVPLKFLSAALIFLGVYLVSSKPRKLSKNVTN